MSVHPPVTDRELKFPVDWEFRIIVDAAAADTARPAIIACVEKHGIDPAIHDGLDSKQGRYHSFKVPVLLTDREMMNRLAGEFAAIDGVKFVL